MIDARLVVLDKDGTLVAFDEMWHTWYRCLLEAVGLQVPLAEDTLAGLAETLGYDRATGAWDPMGPLTLASVSEVVLLMASQLYRHAHKPWDQALDIMERARKIAQARIKQMDLVQPIGDVRGLLGRLHAAGLLLGVATTDDREATERALEKLGVSGYVAAVVCGDDGVPVKPAPDMALEICRRLCVAPAEAIMVGDSVADLIMARRAGYGQVVAVTSGALPRELLAPQADLVIPDIHAIEIIADNTARDDG